MRKCIACGEQKEKKELVRIVNNKEEGVLLDITGKKNGRGAYICISDKCVDKAKKNKRLNVALESEISSEFYEELKKYVDSIRQQRGASMSKVRVHELAKGLNLQSKELINIISGLGVDVKSHMSIIEGKDLEIVIGHFRKIESEKSKKEEKKVVKSENKVDEKKNNVNKDRKDNFNKIWKALEKYQDYLILPVATEKSEPSWFGFIT